ncbi:hypothetical protein QVD17_36863 [Tagetes erecta]|uniref:Uncharacterized protein n=1 Tax=Tagetes erecta TaxID=13708 RepID=A0AAD8NJJ8_TARER|nr:hypothetical protein QVD17_36863 [Tagetes erecta]
MQQDEKYSPRKTFVFCGGTASGDFGIKKNEPSLAMKRGGGAGSCGGKSRCDVFVEMMREGQPYFRVHRGGVFVVVVSAEVIEGPNLDAILEVIV